MADASSLIEDVTSGDRYQASSSDRLRGVLTNPQGSYLLGLIALVLAYYAAAHLGYALHFAGPVASIVWLPVGVGIAFLYLAGVRFWPAVVIGDLLVNNYSALPVGSALGQSVGNLLEIVIAAALLRRLTPRGLVLENVTGAFTVIASVALAAAISATIGVLSLRLGHVINHAVLPVWRTWWLGDFCGALIVVPLAIAWCKRSSIAWLRARAGDVVLLILAVAAISLLATDTAQPLSYLVFPALIFVALRFEQRGATLAVLIVSAFTVWGVTHYHGPFVFHSITRMVFSAQLFLAVASVSVLTFAAIVCERRSLATRLVASRTRLIDAAQNERRRLERDLHDGAQQQLVALAAHLHLNSVEAEEEPSHAGALFETSRAELLVAIDQLRTLAHGIHPWNLSRLGLAGALDDIVAASTIPIQISAAPGTRLDQGVESTAYFIVVEAIVNAEKHSRASRIQVRFDSKPNSLGIEVVDNGIGGAVEHPGSGLEGLRDRVEGVGGTIEIDSLPRRGTRISAQIPASARS